MSHCTCDYHQEQNMKQWENAVCSHEDGFHADCFACGFNAHKNQAMNLGTLKEIASEMMKPRNLSAIIEKKKEAFVEEFENIAIECGLSTENDVKSFLEKAIRESVEEALLEVGNFGEPEKGCDGCEMSCGHALMDFKERVKEFMK